MEAAVDWSRSPAAAAPALAAEAGIGGRRVAVSGGGAGASVRSGEDEVFAFGRLGIDLLPEGCDRYRVCIGVESVPLVFVYGGVEPNTFYRYLLPL